MYNGQNTPQTHCGASEAKAPQILNNLPHLLPHTIPAGVPFAPPPLVLLSPPHSALALAGGPQPELGRGCTPSRPDSNRGYLRSAHVFLVAARLARFFRSGKGGKLGERVELRGKWKTAFCSQRLFPGLAAPPLLARQGVCSDLRSCFRYLLTPNEEGVRGVTRAS